MSTCVSREGEYSDHETGDWCPRCGAFNEEAIVAERDALRATVTAAVAELDKIEDRAPHDIDGMIYTIPWAEGVIAGSKRVRRILTTGSAVRGCDEPMTTPSVEEWAARVHAERVRQPQKGYDADHDRRHGVKHLVNWAIDYVRRGEGEKGAAMMLAVLELVESRERGHGRTYRVDYDLAYDGGGSKWTGYYRTRVGARVAAWWHRHVASWGGAAVLRHNRSGDPS